ncbi:MAG: DNA-3-methyladenine glycosylase I [Gammaproteobacteria bacterium]|nr:MAG: DNA-3-methyladenine glycosylase I [Gammaproteobacteria bacterium]
MTDKPRAAPPARARHAGKRRCWWARGADADYVRYHDEEWGRPVHDDRLLFEMLTLEGAQAGLSWSTILRKRAGYRRAFADFEPRKVARFDARRRTALRRDAGIVRNRLKIESTVSNARAFLALQREFGSFDRYLWSYVAGKPIVNRPRSGAVPSRTPLSDQVSRDLVKRGFRFVGTTIVYAFLQAVGVVNDHARDCFRCPPRRAAGGRAPRAAPPAEVALGGKRLLR